MKIKGVCQPEYILDIRNGKYSKSGAVAKILNENGIKEFPVNVWEIARNLNFEVFDATFEKDNISGMMIDALEVPPMLAKFDCKRAIILNRKEPKNVQSFTVAHELGHFVFDCNEESNYFDALHTKDRKNLSKEELSQKEKEDQIDELNILRWRSHPISWNRAMESVIESQSSDGGSHDPCRGSQ